MSVEIKYTQGFLHRLEDIFAESDHILRYEKGNFKSGFCILKDDRIILVNKYYTTEGKINCLIDILQRVRINTDELSEKNKKLYTQLVDQQPGPLPPVDQPTSTEANT